MPTRLKFSELSDAFEFASAGGPFEQAAYIALHSGKVVYESEAPDETLPADLQDRSRYLPVPTRHELGLGRRLAFLFAEQFMAGDQDTVRDFLSERGGYARFKDLLLHRGQLDAWHDFEARETERTLRAWAEAKGLELR
jgi:hypothetical protein